ncbi:MAG: B12-binding domain-containing radical SAM protein [Acidobacteria bacterium]|nr:B12-binding domain-containing radical SAM protein [Acidobacteriota bacterium]
MKIALLQPPVEDFYQTTIRIQPVGLLYLAAALEKAGHQVHIFDFLSSGEKRAISLPADFYYLKRHFCLADCSPIRMFKHYYHYGATWQAIEQTITQESFDVYGISCMFTPFQGQTERLAKIIRRYFPDRLIVAGGAHATTSPERLLRTSLFDYVFLGEGEISFPRWIAAGSEPQATAGQAKLQRPGPSLQRDGETRGWGDPQTVAVSPPPRISASPEMNRSSVPAQPIQQGERVEDLDSLPFPARHLINLDHYRIDGLRSTMLITSRGCPYHCTFCSIQQTMGYPFRARSIENVLAEIEECVERYDIRYFDIEDDNFTFDQRRAEELMTAILDRFEEGALRFSAMNGLTATRLSESLLRRMRQAGFRQVNLSLIASQPQALRALKRPVSLSSFRHTVKAARAAGLECLAYFILGLPGDDIHRMLETLLALAAEPTLVGPSIFYVSPGTELFDALSHRLPENWDLLRSSTFYMESGSSTRLERMTLFRLTRLINFLKERLDGGNWTVEKQQATEWLEGSKVEGPPTEAILGWTVSSLAARTGKFHAACREQEGEGRYRFFPLPTCEQTVRTFLEMSRHTRLCGTRTRNQADLIEMLEVTNPRRTVKELSTVTQGSNDQ